MRVFVTGATGFIGTAVVKELLANGHTVLGLARSNASSEQLKTLGATALKGTIEDLDALREGARQCDAVIHLAFKIDFGDLDGACAIDRAAISAMGDALLEAGGEKALAVSSGLAMLPQGKLVNEDDEPDKDSPLGAARGPSETLCLGYAAKGLRASVVRLPPSTHGPGSSGFMGPYVSTVMQKGAAVYIGDGNNHWAAGHRDDAAKLYRLAVEKGQAGSTFHASAEEGVKLKDIADAVGQQLGLPVKSVSAEEADTYFGVMKFVPLMDNLASCTKTKESLEWEPTSPSLLDDVPNIVNFIKAKDGKWD